MWYSVCCSVVRGVLTLVCGLKFTVYGKEYIPRSGGFILASNHTSNLDPLVLGISCFRQLNYMAKEELFRNRFFRAILFSVGAFPVKRGTADLGAIRTAFSRVKKGGGLLLFPQGGRRPLTDTADPEPGVGMLCQRMGVPVIPAFVEGSDTALPAGASRIVRGVTVTVRFGPAMMAEKSRDYQQISNRIMKEIRGLSHG